MAVRRESVVLELEDRFTPGIARAAAATELLNQRVNSLSKNAVQSRRASREMGDGFDDVGRRSQKAGAEIDKLSGRLHLMSQVAVTLGPALAPIGAVGVAGIAGLAQQFGFAALAGGTAIAAFQGVGEALKAMNKAQLEPTAANLQAAQIAMEQISPAAQDFVKQLQEMTPHLKELRDSAAAGLFPGMTEGLDALVTRMPDVQRIVGAVAGELGDIAEAGGKSLAGSRWDDFFAFLANEAPKALSDMASATGNVTHALAEMWMAFGPLNSDFSSWMVDATKNLDEWATGLSKTQGFAEFIDYVRTNGPQVAETMGALGNAVLQIVEASAPLGGPVLKGLEAVANVIAAVADSDLGTPIFTALAALSLYNRTLQMTASLSKTAFSPTSLTAGVQSRKAQATGVLSDYRSARASQASMRETTSGMASVPLLRQGTVESDRLRGSLRGMGAEAGKAGALVGALAVATSGAGDAMGVTNAVSLGLAGSMAGPWGAAIGTAVGATIDLTHSTDNLRAAGTAARAALKAGDVDAMAAAYSRLSTEITKTSTATPLAFNEGPRKLYALASGQLGQQRKEQANLAGGINGVAAAGAGLGLMQLAKGFDLTAAGARAAGQSVTEFTKSIALANGVITRSGTFDAYRSSLLDAREAVEKTGKSLRANGDIIESQGRAMKRTGLESRGTLRTLASGALEFAGNMKNAERRTKFLDNARNDFIGVARGMGVARGAAARMADGFGLTDKGARKSSQSVGELRGQINKLKGKIVDAKEKGAKESSPRVQALRNEIARLKGKVVQVNEQGAAASRSRVQSLAASIAAVRSKSVTITTIVARRQGGGTGLAVAQADGGTVPGERQPYGDKVHAYLAPGEEVISNRYGQADRHRELLRRINANALADGGTVQRLANGGTARSGGGGGTSARLRAFQAALAKSTAALQRETTVRDDITSKRAALTSGVTDSFKTDLFAGANVWQAGGGDPLAILKADIAKANAFKATLASLRKAGLDGDALASIASTGDIGKAQALASQGKAGVGQFESLFNQRASAANAVGSYAGYAAYSAQQVQINKTLAASLASQKRLEAQIGHLRKEAGHHAKTAGHETGKAINGAAAKAGRRKGR